MVASLDGSVTIRGSSGGLGNATDSAVLSTLRSLADIVIVGAGTARGEGYGPPRRGGLRIGVATNRGDVDLSSPLFTSGAGFVMAPEAADIDDDAVQVLRCGVDRLDVDEAIHRLVEIVPGASLVQAEGGPVFNGSLLEHDLIDEIALTLSPRLVGGTGPRAVVAPDEIERRFDLAQLLADDDGFVFSRWTRSRPPP
jgi:riboflavin biosynthesis pyrimidine reductase